MVSIPGSSILSGILGIGDSAVKKVLSAINDALTATEKSLSNTITWTTSHITALEHEVGKIASDAVEGAANIASSVFESLVGEIGQAFALIHNLYQTAINYAAGIVHNLHLYVDSVYAYAKSLPKGIEAWAIKNIYNPAIAGIHAAEKFVTATAGAIEKWAIANIYKPLAADISKVKSVGADAINWVEHAGKDAVAVVNGARKWLVWLATQSFDDALAAWTYLSHPSLKRLVSDVIDPGVGLSDHVEEVILGWLDS